MSDLPDLPRPSELTPVQLEAPELPSVAELAEECRSLRMLCIANQVALIIVTVPLCFFLIIATKMIHEETEEKRPIVNELAMNTTPRIQDFIKALQAFAKSDPTFQQILAKYLAPGAVPQPAPPVVLPSKGK
ncbi:MAG TPA: hypothetical protein VGK40_05155 [Verrucomicrobiae bacterium]